MESYNLLRREIRQYVYDKGWPSLKKIQAASIKHTYNTENNFILAAPTASGKTEAAFLPAINSIDDWNTGLKIIYISPLIALINDQFERINELCDYMDITITSWHGEASKTKKKKLLDRPNGILLITPESIEAMLSLRPEEAKFLFKGTEWVIIDEIHSFQDNNRGIQLKSLIERIKKYMEKEARFIGMSATINREDYKNIKNFFGSERKTDVLLDSSKNSLKVTKSFYRENIKKESNNALEEIYDYSQKESMLIFPNSRSEVERLSVSLSSLAKKRKSHTKYFAHHSSVSKDMRLSAENFAKNNRGELFAICCTSTLELGIDIGAVDSIVQYNAPYSIASLGQRLGRSGRATQRNVLHFIATDEWSLLQGLAAISLYEEGIIDKFQMIIKPYDVLAHQIISILLEKSGVPLEELKNINKEFETWKEIEDKELLELIEYLVENKYIEIIEEEAIIGMASEELLRKSEFFTHFNIDDNFFVYNRHTKIGEISSVNHFEIGTNILLSGKVWKIKDIEYRAKKIYVDKAIDGKAPLFPGGSVNTTYDIRKRMEEILKEKSYWESYSKNIKLVLLELADESFRYDKFHWVECGDGLGLRTFQDTKTNRTLELLLNMMYDKEAYTLKDRESTIYGKNIKNDIYEVIEKNYNEKDVFEYLNKHPQVVEKYISSNKYRVLLPNNLKIKYIINNVLDLQNAKNYLKENYQ